MLDFNYEGIQAVNNNKKRLSPYEIYDVEFTSAEVVEFEGVKNPGKKYKVIRFRFDNDEGYYEESIFFPTEEDGQRKKFDSANGEYEVPSNFERTKMFIAQVLTVLNPEGFLKFQAVANAGKFKNFDMMAEFIVKILEPVKGVKTQLKLLGKNSNGTVSAALPQFCRIGQNGSLYCSSNFIGNNLYFSPYEEKKRSEFLNAKPTQMPDISGLNDLLTGDMAKANDMKVDDIADGLDDIESLLK